MTPVGRARAWWLLGLPAVLLVVAAVYAPTINDYFGGDDFLVIGPVNDMGGWELIWKSVILRDNIPYWRPLVSPLYALEVHGFWLRPWAYHLVALSLHLINVTLVVLIARALTGRRGVALASGLLFGVYAAHTTTVAQISSTVELLSVVWYLAAVYCAVRWARPHAPTPTPPPLAWAERGGGSFPVQGSSATGSGGVAVQPDGRDDQVIGGQPRAHGRTAAPLRSAKGGWRGGWGVGALLAFCLALLAKESTASAAGVITVLLFLFVLLPGWDYRRFTLAVAPFWAIVIPYIAFTFTTDTDDPTGIIKHMYFVGGHIGQNMWWFLARLAAPFEVGQGPHVSVAGHVGAAILLITGVLVVLRGAMQARFLVLWTAIALTPLALWRSELLLGRFTYQASIPFAMLLALGGAWLARRIRLLLPPLSPAWAPGLALTVAAVLVYAPLTVTQNRDRTREGESYRVLVEGLRREFPSPPPGSEIVLVDGVWSGPFHALYLEAVADTLYGAGNVRIINADPGGVTEPAGENVVRMQLRDGVLTRLQ